VRAFRLSWPDGHLWVRLGELRASVDVEVRHGGQLLVLRDDELALPPRDTCDLRSDGLWLSLTDEGEGRWTVGLEAFALAVEHPDDDRGDRVPLGLDAEFDAGLLFGELLVGDAAVALDVAAELAVAR